MNILKTTTWGVEVDKMNANFKDLYNSSMLKLNQYQWEHGSINSDGTSATTVINDKIRTIDYVAVRKGQVIGLSDYTSYRFSVNRYSLADKSHLEYVLFRTQDYVVTEDCYIRVKLAYIDNHLFNDITELNHLLQIKSPDAALSENHPLPISAEFRYAVKFPVMGGQGMCIVHNELWHFVHSDVEVEPGVWDDHGQYGDIIRYDLSTGQQLANLTHNLGHCSSVDYNLETDTLLEGNGTWDYTVKPRIDLLLNASTRVGTTDPITITDSDVISIPFFTETKEIGGEQALACWGEDKRIIYLVTGGNSDTRIFRILLGTGTNDFSDPVGDSAILWGTFLEGKGADEFNGTAKVIGSYTGLSADQEIRQGIQFYDGCIWLLSGWQKERIMKIKCYDDGYFRNVDMINLTFFNADGTTAKPEPQGLVIHNHYAYIGLKSPIGKICIIPITGKQGGIGTVGTKVMFDFKVNNNPNIQITPLSSTIDLYISLIETDGFTVQSVSEGSGTFNWECYII